MIDQKVLDTDAILDMIERDFPGWDYLFRSNVNTGLDATGASERYFANIMTPEFEGRVLETPRGIIDISPGHRFTAYANTRSAALGMAYEKALGWVAEQGTRQPRQ